MVTGDNAGHKYEKEIESILKRKKISILKGSAGSGGGSDLKLQEGSLELKNNVTDPDYGQCIIKPMKVDSRWIWDWSEQSKKKKPELIEFYNNLKCVDGTVGVLEYINKKNITPNKHRVSDELITRKMKEEDQRLFEDRKNKVPVEAFDRFYKKTSDYVQIGAGYGFFHINSDVANLGTEKFNAEFTLRLRAKSFDNHYPVCTVCKQRYKPRTLICKQCKINLKTDMKKTCKDCGKSDVNYNMFEHVWFDYGFIVVMKCDKIQKKSKFNIEDFPGQDFPPFKS